MRTIALCSLITSFTYFSIMKRIIDHGNGIITTGVGIRAFLINQYLLTSDPLKPGAPDLPGGPCENKGYVIILVSAQTS